MKSQENIRNAISRNFKYYREKHKFNQRELAEKLGISQTKVSEVESGKRELSGSELILFCRVFDICSCMLYDDKNCHDD